MGATPEPTAGAEAALRRPRDTQRGRSLRRRHPQDTPVVTGGSHWAFPVEQRRKKKPSGAHCVAWTAEVCASTAEGALGRSSHEAVGGTCSRPAPCSLKMWRRRWRVSPSAAVFVLDNSAKNDSLCETGADAIGVGFGCAPSENRRDAACHLLHDVRELRQLRHESTDFVNVRHDTASTNNEEQRTKRFDQQETQWSTIVRKSSRSATTSRAPHETKSLRVHPAYCWQKTHKRREAVVRHMGIV